MNLRVASHALLFLTLVITGCATSTPSVVYPDTANRLALMNTIIEKSSMAVVLAKDDQKKQSASEQNALAESKTAKEKANSKVVLPDAYWQQYQAIELKFIKGIGGTDAQAFDDYKSKMRSGLARATDDELTEIAASKDLSANGTFRKLIRNYDAITVGFFSDKNIHTRDVLQTYFNDISALDKQYKK